MAIEVHELAKLRLTDAMREMILNPIDKTLGGLLVVAYHPRRTCHALQHKGLVDVSCRLTPLGMDVKDALERQQKARKAAGLGG